jgi:hypothetical protein
VNEGDRFSCYHVKHSICTKPNFRKIVNLYPQCQILIKKILSSL